jgi:hypothetical protein
MRESRSAVGHKKAVDGIGMKMRADDDIDAFPDDLTRQ